MVPGGWFSNKEKPQKEDLWFHYKVAPDKHVWAFEKGDPQFRISTFEMFGSLLLAKFLVMKDDGSIPNLRIPWSRTIRGMSTPC